jgi:hypothetical protein
MKKFAPEGKRKRSHEGLVFIFFIIYIIKIKVFVRIDLWVQMGECMARWLTYGITFIFLWGAFCLNGCGDKRMF